MVHLGTQLIYTDRLVLRPYRKGDEYQMYRNFLGDPAVTQYVSWETYQSVSVARELLELHLYNYRFDPFHYYEWAVEFEGEIVGSVDAFDIQDDIRSCEIGCTIGSRYWGRGIATEAIGAIIYYLFEEVGFRRISASHYAENTSAALLLLNAGMQREGRLRGAARRSDGTFDDLICYGVLREDMRTQKKRHGGDPGTEELKES